MVKSKLTEAEKDQALSRLTFTDRLANVKDVDFCIEAISEDEEAKQRLFRQLNDLFSSDHTIMASNTSSISITKLASSYKRPDRFVGMHFMNPGTTY